MKKRYIFIVVIASILLAWLSVLTRNDSSENKVLNNKPKQLVNSPVVTNPEPLKSLNNEAPLPKTDLRIEGLDSPWESARGSRSLKFLTDVKFDKLRLMIKGQNLEDKEFTTTQSEMMLEPLLAGRYQAQAFAYLNEELVTRSELIEFEVVMNEENLPEVDSKLKEVELYF